METFNFKLDEPVTLLWKLDGDSMRLTAKKSDQNILLYPDREFGTGSFATSKNPPHMASLRWVFALFFI
ncbi:hypothetical protein ACFOLF_26200 [Paenibacillus sepulcri]|uniref:Uncharacterized protein n=1 Tax=Paenibacillus sepulcri TaxID=359917 RepID=A0ABS7BY69_9BACL|nr:hypothetical protein [Paenibacillus sepulcri]